MMSVKTKTKGNAKTYIINVERKFNQVPKILEKYGKIGVEALMSATPWKTGATALSWSYEIIREGNTYRLRFNNSNIVNGINIAIIVDRGHPTANGGWVEGRDYINPVLQPIFDDILRQAWGEIKEL